ncbi:MAG: hypothetical protein P4L33_14475 [Capsulimonadaceae bacterium]|nr:hypothetical protein [Capsulimonadaceae bacterium]
MSDDRDKIDEALRDGLASLPVRKLRAAEFNERVLVKTRRRGFWGQPRSARFAMALAFAAAAVVLIASIVGTRLAQSGGLSLTSGTPLAQSNAQPPRDLVSRIGALLIGLPSGHTENAAHPGGDKKVGGLVAPSNGASSAIQPPSGDER